jgi:hypothetical protein
MKAEGEKYCLSDEKLEEQCGIILDNVEILNIASEEKVLRKDFDGSLTEDFNRDSNQNLKEDFEENVNEELKEDFEENFIEELKEDFEEDLKVTHCNEKPYECQICGKQFKQSSVLKFHTSYHGEPQIPCGVCNKMLRNAYVISNTSINLPI